MKEMYRRDPAARAMRRRNKRQPVRAVAGLMLIAGGVASAYADDAARDPTSAAPRRTADTASAQSATLPAVTVQSSALGARTEGSASYTTGSTATATRLPLSLRDTPQSVSVITRQRIDDEALIDLRDVMDHTTGVSVRVNDSERVAFYSRGFRIDNYEYDGVPTTMYDNTSNFGDNASDMALYDRVEVIRGANGLLTGAGNPAAVINLVRKRPGKTFSASATARAGSYDFYRGEADISTPLSGDGRIRARVVGAGETKGSFMDRYHGRKTVLYGIVEADLTADTTASVGWSYQNTRRSGVTWGGLPIYFSDGSRTDFARSAAPNTDWSHWNTEASSVFVDLEHRLANGWKARAVLTHSNNRSDAKLFSLSGVPDRLTGLGTTASPAHFLGYRQQNSVDVYATGPFRLLGQRHELAFGWSGSHQSNDSHSHAVLGTPAPTGSLYGWNGAYPEPAFSAGTASLTHGEVDQSGVYGAARLSLADPLKLVLGARVSRYRLDSVSGSTRSHLKESSVFTPYAGLVFDLSENLSAYTSYTEIFSPQQRYDANNRMLDPITGKNYEVGLKGEFLNGRLNGSLALFRTLQDNVAQLDPSGTILPDGSQAYIAAHGTRTQGFEFDVSGEVARDWHVYAGYSHYTSKDASGNAVNTNIPRTSAKLFASYRLPDAWHKLTLGAGLNWQSRNETVVASPRGRVAAGQGAFALVSLLARYDIDRHWSAALNVDNLFDKKYYSQIGFYTQEAYGTPRTVIFTLRYAM